MQTEGRDDHHPRSVSSYNGFAQLHKFAACFQVCNRNGPHAQTPWFEPLSRLYATSVSQFCLQALADLRTQLCFDVAKIGASADSMAIMPNDLAKLYSGMKDKSSIEVH